MLYACICMGGSELQVLRAPTAKVYALISEKEKLANYLHHRHIINMAGSGAKELQQDIRRTHVCSPSVLVQSVTKVT